MGHLRKVTGKAGKKESKALLNLSGGSLLHRRQGVARPEAHMPGAAQFCASPSTADVEHTAAWCSTADWSSFFCLERGYSCGLKELWQHAQHTKTHGISSHGKYQNPIFSSKQSLPQLNKPARP
eukprot:scaffold29425_cov16-Tisochrysis_lutea.AAC.2